MVFGKKRFLVKNVFDKLERTFLRHYTEVVVLVKNGVNVARKLEVPRMSRDSDPDSISIFVWMLLNA